MIRNTIQNKYYRHFPLQERITMYTNAKAIDTFSNAHKAQTLNKDAKIICIVTTASDSDEPTSYYIELANTIIIDMWSGLLIFKWKRFFYIALVRTLYIDKQSNKQVLELRARTLSEIYIHINVQKKQAVHMIEHAYYF